MRYLGIVSLLTLSMAALAPIPASAQGGTPMGDLLDKARLATRPVFTQWSATRPAALAGLSRESRQWLTAELQRQAESPRSPAEVASDIDKALANDIHSIAKSQRLHAEDVSGALLIKVLMDTKDALAREGRKAARSGNPAVDEQWNVRVAQAEGNLRTAIEMQSSVSLAMARD